MKIHTQLKNPAKIENKEWLAFAAIHAFLLIKGLAAIYGSHEKTHSFPLEILLITAATGCISLAYLISKEKFGHAPGLFAAAISAWTFIFLEPLSSHPAEIISISLALTSAYFFIKEFPAASSITAFAASVFNPLNALLIPLFAGTILLRKENTEKYLKTCLPFALLLIIALSFKTPLLLERFQPESFRDISGILSRNLFHAFLPLGLFFVLKDLKKIKKGMIAAGLLGIASSSVLFQQASLASIIIPSGTISGYGLYRILITKTGTSWKGRLIILAVGTMAAATLIKIFAEIML